MLGLANAWCRNLEEEEMKEEKERRKRKRRGGGGGGGGESVENLVRGDSFKAKAEAKPKQSKIHKTRRQAGGFWVHIGGNTWQNEGFLIQLAALASIGFSLAVVEIYFKLKTLSGFN